MGVTEDIDFYKDFTKVIFDCCKIVCNDKDANKKNNVKLRMKGLIIKVFTVIEDFGNQ